MSRVLRQKSKVCYAEGDVDGSASGAGSGAGSGLLKYAKTGVKNTDRSISPAKEPSKRSQRRKNKPGDMNSDKAPAKGRELPKRAGRPEGLKEVSITLGASDGSDGSSSDAAQRPERPQRRSTRDKAPAARASMAEPPSDAGDESDDADLTLDQLAAKHKKTVLEESDDEGSQQQSDSYQPPAVANNGTGRRRSRRPAEQSDEDMAEASSESESVSMASEQEEEEQQSGSEYGNKRSSRTKGKGKGKKASLQPERQSARSSHKKHDNLQEDALQLGGQQDGEDTDMEEAETDASEQSGSDDQSGSHSSGEEVEIVSAARTSSRIASAKQQERSGAAKGPKQQKLQSEKQSRANDEPPAPPKPKAFRADTVEKILDVRENPEGNGKQLYVKIKGQAYRHASWQSYDKVMAGKPQLVRNFMQRRSTGRGDEGSEDLVNGVHPDWLMVERIISQRMTLRRQEYLVKWYGLGYAEATWELATNLEEDKDHIDRFHAREKPLAMGDKDVEFPSLKQVPQFENGRELRDYQKTSLEWMMTNCRDRRNCILGDEMGLGKTAQSIAALEFQRQLCKRHGPYLVIAPLTTLGHWQREIEAWTTMNVVLFAGTAADREAIHMHEWDYAREGKRDSKRKLHRWKFTVLLTSYETVRQESSLFRSVPWSTVIVDEAHRLKMVNSQSRKAITSLPMQWLLLLTGTPVQNSMKELGGIMSLLNQRKYGNEEFAQLYGSDDPPPTVDQIRALQAALQPVLLRRMKEDVEQLPEKEEVVVWVELTQQQRIYYKALYANQIGALLQGAGKAMPNLRNLAMELRKVCCHPFLCDGLEDDVVYKQLQQGKKESELDSLINASGKMVLLFKLLPKLRREGHKVLVFSQFKIMLNVIEDALKLAGMPTERIDGSVSSRDRQTAIDRFSKGQHDSFVFLLSTRAGGQGITLTAADTVIIYDSDWNPQNDLQAMARCHRIGQAKEVTIYRLVCRDTYEAQIFQTSSRKYGLDEAILGNMGGTDPEKDSKAITDLLKHGAHSILAQDEVKARDGENFAREDIDAILAGRTEKRQLGSRAGNTFSTATFAVQEQPPGQGQDAQTFWGGLMPDAVADHHEQQRRAAMPSPLQPRQRKQVQYIEDPTPSKAMGRSDSESDHTATVRSGGGSSSGSDSSGDDEQPEVKEGGKGGRPKNTSSIKQWAKGEVKLLEDRLVSLGRNHDTDLAVETGISGRTSEDVEEVKDFLLAAIGSADSLMKAAKALKEQRRREAFAIDPFMVVPPPDNADEVPVVARQLVQDIQGCVPPQMARAMECEDLQARLARNGSKYQAQVQQRSDLNTLMRDHAAGLATAINRVHYLLHDKLRPCAEVAGWTVQDDLRLLQVAHKQGYASWLRRSGEQMLSGLHAAGGSSTVNKLEAQSQHDTAAKRTAMDLAAGNKLVQRKKVERLIQRLREVLKALSRTLPHDKHVDLYKQRLGTGYSSEEEAVASDDDDPDEDMAEGGSGHVTSHVAKAAQHQSSAQPSYRFGAWPEHSNAAKQHKPSQPASLHPTSASHPTAKPAPTLGAAAFPVRKSPVAAGHKPAAVKPAHHRPAAGKEPSPDTVFSNHMRTLSVAERDSSSDSEGAAEVVRQPRLLQGANKSGAAKPHSSHKQHRPQQQPQPAAKARVSSAGAKPAPQVIAMDVDSDEESLDAMTKKALGGKENAIDRPASGGHRSGLPAKRKESIGHHRKHILPMKQKQSVLPFIKKPKPSVPAEHAI